VEAADENGNVGGFDAEASAPTLTVDRTSPVLTEVQLESSGPLSDLDAAPLRVTARVDDPAAIVTINVGALVDNPCTVTDAGDVACELSLLDAGDRLADGDNTVTLVATDAAGNASDDAKLVVAIDVAPPGVIDAATTLALSAPGGAPQAVATAGTRIAGTFFVTEPLATAPTAEQLAVAIVVGEGVEVALAPVVTGARVDASAVVAGDVPAGTYAMRVTLTDVVGHTTTLPLPLLAPFAAGVPFGPVTGSLCPAPGAIDACVDADGDGFFAAGPCASGDDCNDVDPSVFPNAPEIPGDEVANDCGPGADAPVDETTGVFVDCAGAPGGTGDRDSPFEDIRAAMEAFVSNDRPRMLYVSDAPCTIDDVSLDASFVGGFDAATWTRAAGARTPLALDPGPTIQLVGNGVFVGADLPTLELASNGRQLIKDVDVGIFTVHGEALAMRMRAQQIAAADDASTRLVEVTVADFDGPSFIRSEGDLFLHRVSSGRIIMARASAALVATSSAIEHDGANEVEALDCLGPCTLVHTTIARTAGASSAPLVFLHNGANALRACSLVDTGSQWLVEVSAGATVTLTDNAFARRLPQLAPLANFGGTPGAPGPVTVDTVAELEGASAPELTDAVGNAEVPAIPFDDDVHPSAQWTGHDRVAPGALADAPSALVDLDGECRYDDDELAGFGAVERH
jgi:hypothetical protein